MTEYKRTLGAVPVDGARLLAAMGAAIDSGKLTPRRAWETLALIAYPELLVYVAGVLFGDAQPMPAVVPVRPAAAQPVPPAVKQSRYGFTVGGRGVGHA